MSRLIDRTGQRYGRLVVLGQAGSDKNRNRLWQCSCDCGKETVCRGDHLASGATQSCGCLHRETTGAASRTHGQTGTKAYRAFSSAKRRCNYPKEDSYPLYGGRGIQFLYPSFEAFLADLGEPPSESHTLDRINPDGHYKPGNCRWATTEEQANNKRSNRLLTFQGRTQTLAQWGKEVGIIPSTLGLRIDRYRWSVEKALTTPLQVHQ